MRHPVGLRVIGIFKLLSALLLTCVGFGIFRWIGYEQQHNMQAFAEALRLEPQKHLIHNFLAKLTGVSERKLHAIGAATFVYAVLYLIEGIGLLKEKRWAEYLTIIITASLMPFELYELARHFDLNRVLVFVGNLAIVIYLVRQLRRS